MHPKAIHNINTLPHQNQKPTALRNSPRIFKSTVDVEGEISRGYSRSSLDHIWSDKSTGNKWNYNFKFFA